MHRGKRNIAIALLVSAAGAAVFAAALFVAYNQPWGYVSPPALNTTNFGSGSPLHEITDSENAIQPDDLFLLTVATSSRPIQAVCPVTIWARVANTETAH